MHHNIRIPTRPIKMLVVASAFILFAAFVLCKFYKRPGFYKRVPTVRGLPFIGIAHRLINPLDTLNVFYECFKEYGPNFVFNIGPKNWVVIGELNFLERILSSTTNIRKAEDYGLASSWLGNGLIVSEGQHWKTHRKAITPTFHLKILEQFITVFNKESDVLVNKLKQEVGKNSFNVYKYTTLFALDAICETAMGSAHNFQNNPNHPYPRKVTDMNKILYKRCTNPFYKINWMYKLTTLYKTEKAALEEINSFCNNIVKSRNKKGLIDKEYKDDFNRKQRVCFLDMLLQHTIDGHPLTSQDIQDEVNTFMFAGHDTTAIGISLVLYSLSRNVDIQDNLYDEIISVMGSDETIHPTYNDLNEMKYLEMVIKETLRLYPSAPLFSRHLIDDVQYNDIVIPGGTHIVIFPYLVHRDPSIYPEPEKFIPERFTMEENLKRHPYGYLAFSAGPRNCIGQKYAVLEIKAAVSKILRQYKILPAVPECEPKLTCCVTIDSANGVHIAIQERL